MSRIERISPRPPTHKQQRFVEEYLVDFNATQAAIRAGYSRKTARQIGEENLTKPDIKNCIKEALKERRDHCQIKGDDLTRELSRLVFADIREVFVKDEKGRVHLRPISEIPEETARAIATMRSITRQYKDGRMIRRVTVRMHDKVAALSLLAKYLGYHS